MNIPISPICASKYSRVAKKEFWVNVYFSDVFNRMSYGMKHFTYKKAIEVDAGSLYRIHVKMKDKK